MENNFTKTFKKNKSQKKKNNSSTNSEICIITEIETQKLDNYIVTEPDTDTESDTELKIDNDIIINNEFCTITEIENKSYDFFIEPVIHFSSSVQ
jgi:hypothetical protein